MGVRRLRQSDTIIGAKLSVFRDPDGVILVFTEPYTAESAKKLGASEEFGKPPSK
jgi:hypothetical protein